MSLRGDTSDENLERYNELSEEWFLNNENCPPSSSDTATLPSHIVIKRETYPHWEEGCLKDEVVVGLHGMQDETAHICSEFKSSGTETVTPSRSRATDATVLTELAVEEPKNGQLYGQSPNHSSPFTSSAPPHLPLATHFPPLDNRARLLESKSEEKQETPTFSFSRLQMMAGDSADRKSTLCSLTGLHNQVQGSPHNPSLWQYASDIEQKDNVDSSSPGKTDGDSDEVVAFPTVSKTAEDARDDSTVNGWPIMKDEQLAGLRPIELAFDDTFNPSLSSALPDSGYGCQSHHNTTVCRIESGFGQRTEYTCDHTKHYVRPLLLDVHCNDGASGDSEASWSCSELGSGPDDTGDSADRVRQVVLTDVLSAIEDYAGSESSTRANASSASLNYTVDSRTSSELYLSPNFPDSDHRNDRFAELTPTQRSGESDTSTDEDRDIHRVHFPTQAAQAPFGSALLKFFNAARRRVSSISGASFATTRRKEPHYMRRNSLAAVTEHEKGKRLTNGALPIASDPDKMRLPLERGRSLTLRPHEPNAPACNSESPFIEDLYILGHKPEMTTLADRTTRRFSGTLNFVRRFSQQLGRPADEVEKLAIRPQPTPSAPVSPPIADTRPEQETRTRTQSGATLFRSFRLARPRTPRTDGRRGAGERD